MVLMAAHRNKTVGKQAMLSSVTQKLHEVVDFLSTYLPLANAHSSEFIAEQHWKSLLPDKIQSELLSFTEDELSSLPLLGVCKISDKTHITHLEKGMCEKFHINTDNDIANIAITCSSTIGIDQLKGDHTEICEVTHTTVEAETDPMAEGHVWKHKSVSNFYEGALRCSIDSSGLSVSVDEVFNAFSAECLDRHTFIKSFMNEKKAHEVEVMSGVCAFMAAATKCDMVIDVGSGKGYLGNSLYLQHNLAVLGIDAVEDNSLAAGNRTNMLEKQWHGLTLNARMKTQSEQFTKKEKKKIKQSKFSTPVAGDDKQSVGTAHLNASENRSKCILSNPSVTSNPVASNMECTCHILGDQHQMPPCYIPVTLFIDKSTDFTKVARDHIHIPLNRYCVGNESCACLETAADEIDTNCGLAVGDRLTHKRMELLAVNEANDMVGTITSHELLDSSCKEKSASARLRMLLTGLHTCGNLGSSTLELFVNNQDISAVCGVGCCYHLVDEKFLNTPACDNGTSCSFPISKYLQERHFSLGKNARNLASQSVSRVSTFSQLQGERFFPRALLQVIIAERVGLSNVEWKGLRKLERKCSGTKHYIRMACQKLAVSEDTVSDETIEAYMEKYEDDRRKLAAFFQLRAVLAPCIEAAVLLDRLCYLLEQDIVDTVLLVKLFDPMLSPRCYGIVASKIGA